MTSGKKNGIVRVIVEPVYKTTTENVPDNAVLKSQGGTIQQKKGGRQEVDFFLFCDSFHWWLRIASLCWRFFTYLVTSPVCIEISNNSEWRKRMSKKKRRRK